AADPATPLAVKLQTRRPALEAPVSVPKPAFIPPVAPPSTPPRVTARPPAQPQPRPPAAAARPAPSNPPAPPATAPVQPAPPPQPSAEPARPGEAAKRDQIGARNLGLGRTPVCGGSRDPGGGIFQITNLHYSYAEFMFFGWNKHIRRNTSQRIEVRKGEHKS